MSELLFFCSDLAGLTAQNSTIVLKVDLNCSECYKKIKRALCRFSCEIRSQIIDKKTNTVVISGPFDPNCIARKLCCKAGKAIISYEIMVPKPDPPKTPAPPPEPASKEPAPAPKEPEPKPAPAPAPKKPEPAPAPAPAPKEPEPAPAPAPAPKEPPLRVPIIFEPEPITVPGFPPNFGTCCGQCYQGHGGGPCHNGFGAPLPFFDGYGRPPPQPQPCFDNGYYGNNNYGRPKGYVVCDYFSEENPGSCTIM
ncbi:hypothetical protein MKW94_020918 [Papaver nudicaule]|uniref:HMA domain-containing protein n=1 Tax=Papaver nudicaule TaxID=74823 RepID=A0AA41VET8_PAPNU|nr:hypothetical protein [Papaver nudicaule]